MLTTTTLEDSRRPNDQCRHEDLNRRGPQNGAPVADQSHWIDLDADFEQKQYDSYVRQDLELPAIHHVSRREWRDDESDHKVADDRRQTKPARYPARGHRQQKQESNLKDRGRCLQRSRCGQRHLADPILRL